MGFCLYNNVAIAAAHARTLGADRVAIVDYDVHHGNGTQHTFEDDPSVLYVSTHQYPFYPGTGAVGEIGVGNGAGFTVNLPLEAGAVDDDYRMAFSEVIMPVLTAFKPDLVLVSAGFDAHERDPLAGMRLTTAAFVAMTAELAKCADQVCRGRLVAITEGGYDLRALGDSLRGVLMVLASDRPQPEWPAPSSVAPTRGRASVTAAKQALARYWKV
jgi:acetoin utilization deacetylase AcuC-like enzyme